MAEKTYLHGYSKKEQDRLLHQAKFLQPYVYPGIELKKNHHLLEVGCGVGAQTKIITQLFPHLKIDGVDLSQEQLATAQQVLRQEIKAGQVQLFHQDVMRLKLKNAGHYDAAFLCWFLEHLPNPLGALKKIRSQLKSGAKIYCTEVFNQTLFIEPYSPAYLKYWFEFNDYQWSIHGHPQIGAQLGHLLQAAGFVEVETEIRPFHFDSRNAKKRAAFADYFFKILLSAEKTLLAEGRVTKKQIETMKAEVKACKKAKDAVFFYAFVRATARVP